MLKQNNRRQYSGAKRPCLSDCSLVASPVRMYICDRTGVHAQYNPRTTLTTSIVRTLDDVSVYHSPVKLTSMVNVIITWPIIFVYLDSDSNSYSNWDSDPHLGYTSLYIKHSHITWNRYVCNASTVCRTSKYQINTLHSGSQNNLCMFIFGLKYIKQVKMSVEQTDFLCWIS